MDRKKIYAGVVLLCAAALLMLIGQDIPSPSFRVLWVVLLGAGLFLYLWGRFFSRDRA